VYGACIQIDRAPVATQSTVEIGLVLTEMTLVAKEIKEMTYFKLLKNLEQGLESVLKSHHSAK
jgi:hypothetical protein